VNVKLLQRLHKKRVPTLKQLGKIQRLLSPFEQTIFRIASVVFLVGLVWFTVGIIDSKRVHVAAQGGQYREAVVGSPQLINPLFASLNNVDSDISRLVFNGLMQYDENQKLITDLAESYEVSEDKKVYTFTLRDNVVWHDGEPFTSSDVAFAIKTIQNAQVNSPLMVSFQGVAIDTPDPKTVQFTLSEPFAPFLSSLTVGIIPEHIWSDVGPDRIRLAKSNLQPIGTGPFQFEKLKKNDAGYILSYTLARNENYFATKPYLDEFIFEFFGDYDGLDGAIQAMREQKVDGLDFVPYDLKDKVERKHIVLHTLQLPQYTALFFNQKNLPALKDSKLREALALSLDKRRIMRSTIGDNGQVIHGPILPGFPGYSTDEMKTRDYSVEKANDLLEESWEKISGDTYRETLLEERLKEWDKSQKASSSTEEELASLREEAKKEVENQLNTELQEAQTFYRQDKKENVLEIRLVTADTKEYRQAAQMIAGFWQGIGVKTKLEFIPAKNMVKDVLKDRDYDVLLYRMIVGSDPDLYPFWHSSQTKYPGLNLSLYASDEVDKLLGSARETSDPEEYGNIYKQIQEKIFNDVPAVFLYMPTYTYATTDKLQGYTFQRIFIPSDRFSGVTSWYIKEKGKWQF